MNAPLYLEEAATAFLMATIASAASPPSDIEGGSVIVADDNADMRDFLRRLLTDEGLSVIAVEDGVAALEAARLQPPTRSFRTS